MSRTAFDPIFDQLPGILPIFPLSGALLLPGGRLPLNIFEPRYLEMFDNALAGDRLIGMIQPTGAENKSTAPPVYGTGCAGRLVSFTETEDGRYLVTLAGLIRFDVAQELAPLNYRRVVPDYGRFRDDLSDDPRAIDRGNLLRVLKHYFQCNAIDSDWDAIEEADDERLVTSLAMLCPLGPQEKQLILEAMTLPERAETLTVSMEMASHSRDGQTARH